MCKKVAEKMPWYLGYVSDHFKTEEMLNNAFTVPLSTLKSMPGHCFKNFMKQEIWTWDGITGYRLCMMCFDPDRLKRQDMCSMAICIDPYSLEFVPDRFKIQEMFNEAMRREPYALRYVPNHLRTQEMCDEAVCIILPDEYKTKGICSEAVDLITLRHKDVQQMPRIFSDNIEDICTYGRVF